MIAASDEWGSVANSIDDDDDDDDDGGGGGGGDGGDGGGGDGARVQVYAVLREDWTTAGGHTVCASQSDADAQLIYTSKSNVVEARLVTQLSSAQFLIKVERNASSRPACPSYSTADVWLCFFSQQFNAS